MAIETSPNDDLDTMTVLDGALTAIRSSPLILGLFLLSGILQVVLPSIVDSTARIVLLSIGVVVAYQALGGQLRADSSFIARLLVSLLVMIVISLLPLVGITTFFFFGFSGYTGIALVVLTLSFVLGLYVYIRLLLSIPSVMIDGDGPRKALSKSWQLTDGSVLPITGAIGLVCLIGLIILYPVFSQSRSPLVLPIGSTLIVDTLLVAIQAVLYSHFANTNGVPQPN